MAQYQNKKSELTKSRFKEIFGDLPKESQIKLIECLSKIQKGARL